MTDLKQYINGRRAAKEAIEVARHFHNLGEGTIWFGWDGAAGGLRDSSVCYQIASGVDAYGGELLILDAGDTPVATGMATFDPHLVVICDTSTDGLWYFRFWIDSGDGVFANAEIWTTAAFSLVIQGGRIRTSPVSIGCAGKDVGLKMWAEAKLAGGGGGETVDFVIGLHEYPPE